MTAGPEGDGEATHRAAVRREGAWGWRWSGIGEASSALNPAPPSWPEVVVTVLHDAAPTSPACRPGVWTPGRAEFPLRGGGHIVIGADPPSVELHLFRPVPPECVAQPHLASAAAALGIWAGCQALHGGAFVHAGRAWALVGDKGAGKSTALAQLAQAGVSVLADDLMIWRDGQVLAGPRCVDLRPEAAEALGIGRRLGIVGSRERWRVDLTDVPASVPFAGLIRLEWAAVPALLPLTLADRLSLVLANGPLPVAVRPTGATLDLVGGEGLTWTRPKDWNRTTDAIRCLLGNLPTV